MWLPRLLAYGMIDTELDNMLPVMILSRCVHASCCLSGQPHSRIVVLLETESLWHCAVPKLRLHLCNMRGCHRLAGPALHEGDMTDSLARSALAGLRALHVHGVAHGDVTLSNFVRYCRSCMYTSIAAAHPYGFALLLSAAPLPRMVSVRV